MTEPRDLSIWAQSAAHDAAAIYAALHSPGEAFDVGEFANVHSQLYLHVREFIEAEQEALATAKVQAAFPGSEQVPTQQYVAPPTPGQQENVLQFPPQMHPAQAHEQQQVPVPAMAGAPAPQGGLYVPPAPPQGYQPPFVPQPQPQPSAPQYPPPPVPQAPPAGGMNCPKCGGPMYDNRNDNQRRRASGYKLSSDFKCKNRACGNVIWPADFSAYANHPQEPR